MDGFFAVVATIECFTKYIHRYRFDECMTMVLNWHLMLTGDNSRSGTTHCHTIGRTKVQTIRHIYWHTTNTRAPSNRTKQQKIPRWSSDSDLWYLPTARPIQCSRLECSMRKFDYIVSLLGIELSHRTFVLIPILLWTHTDITSCIDLNFQGGNNFDLFSYTVNNGINSECCVSFICDLSWYFEMEWIES